MSRLEKHCGKRYKDRVAFLDPQSYSITGLLPCMNDYTLGNIHGLR